MRGDTKRVKVRCKRRKGKMRRTRGGGGGVEGWVTIGT